MRCMVWFFCGFMLLSEYGWASEDSAVLVAQEEREDQSSGVQGSMTEPVVDPEGESDGMRQFVQEGESRSKKKGRQRDADGSRAPNRFEGEIIIKSRYELNGQPLEVDTD